MTRLTLFDSPLFLGFDQFEKTVDRLRKAGADGYPLITLNKSAKTACGLPSRSPDSPSTTSMSRSKTTN